MAAAPVAVKRAAWLWRLPGPLAGLAWDAYFNLRVRLS